MRTQGIEIFNRARERKKDTTRFPRLAAPRTPPHMLRQSKEHAGAAGCGQKRPSYSLTCSSSPTIIFSSACSWSADGGGGPAAMGSSAEVAMVARENVCACKRARVFFDWRVFVTKAVFCFRSPRRLAFSLSHGLPPRLVGRPAPSHNACALLPAPMDNLHCVAAHDAAVPGAPAAAVAAVAVDGGTGARYVATMDGRVCRVDKDGTVSFLEAGLALIGGDATSIIPTTPLHPLTISSPGPPTRPTTPSRCPTSSNWTPCWSFLARQAL